MPVQPSPLVAALASSSHDPNCRNEVAGDTAPAADIAADVSGADDVEIADVAVGVVGFGVFGAFGRPRPWAAASEQTSTTMRSAPKGSRREFITSPRWCCPFPALSGPSARAGSLSAESGARWGLETAAAWGSSAARERPAYSSLSSPPARD